LIALTVAAAVATYRWHPRAPQLYEVLEPPVQGEVSVAEVAERWQNNVLWVDARSEEAYAKGHIDAAILINEQHRDAQVLANIEAIQDMTKPMVIYCDGHACQASHKVRSYFIEHMGHPNIWVLKGGWPAWEKAHAK
jgi:3-mercaptopyruvate sulfurtransferase SseA